MIRTMLFLTLTLSALSIVARPSVAGAEIDDRPNVILIVSDDQGWADIGYNNDAVYSPNLDTLAASGAVLVNNYVMPQCTPTRVALMTGRYPSRFGGPAQQASNAPAFPLDTPTMSRMFKDAGYATSLAGKWHLGSRPEHGPNHFGFDSSYGSLTGAVGMYDHRYRTGEFEHTWHRDHQRIEGDENGVHATDLTAREAVRVITQPRDTPFFLYLPFHAVHTPLDERGPYVDRPTQRDPENPQRWLDEREIRWFNDPDGKIQSEPDPEKRLFLAAVYHFDHAIGEILDALDETSQRDRTLIIFTSDNGPQVNWGGNAYPDDLKLSDFNQPIPFRGKKVDVWEGGIHVPGFVSWPGRIEPREVEDPIHAVDWYPTLAAIIGHEPGTPVAWDGIDVSPALLDGSALPTRDLYWTWGANPNRRAFRHGDWKLVHYGRPAPTTPDAWSLFNLADDPAEQHDLAATLPEVVTRLHERYRSHRALDAR